MFKIFRATAIIGALASLAACSGANNGLITIPGQQPLLRIVDGSPDAGPITVTVDGTNVAPSGSGTINYGQILAYKSYNTGTHTITVTGSGFATQNYTTPPLGNNGVFSVVFAGTVAKGNLQFIEDAENTYNQSPALNILYASPNANILSPSGLAYGYFTPPASGYTKLGTLTFQASNSTPGSGNNGFNQQLPQTSNVGFYVDPAASPTAAPPMAQITLSQIDASNSTNTFGGNDLHLSLFVIDCTTSTANVSCNPATGVGLAGSF